MAPSKPWRIAAGAAIIAAGGWAVWQLCLLPYRCAAAMAPLQMRTLRAAEISATETGRIMARQNLERLDDLPASCHDEVDWIMLAAANSRIVGERQRAVDEYTRALALYQRPEVYYNRGMTLLEMRQIDRAVPDLAVAVAFNPVVMENLDEETQRLVKSAIASHRYNPPPF